MVTTKKMLTISARRVESHGFDNILVDQLRDIIEITPRENTAFHIGSMRGDETQYQIEYSEDDIAELKLDGGLTIYSTIDQLREDYFPDLKQRGSDSGFSLPTSISTRDSHSRGAEEIGIESIQLLDIKKMAVEAGGKVSALLLAKALESTLYGEEALYRLQFQETTNTMEMAVCRPEEIPTNQPILVFLHGTFSSTAGSFSALWEDVSDSIWKKLVKKYGTHLYALEHRTLTRSPIENCLTLIRALPANCELHLVSHSRGGLVGELLCRATFQNGREPFTEKELEGYQRKKDSLPSSLMELLVDGYREQREQLQELNQLLIEKKPKITRFVRVACPARGTTLVSGRLDKYCNTLLNLIGLIPALRVSPFYSFIKAFLLAVVKERTSPELLPGLEAQMPDSPLIRLLNTSSLPLDADLRVIKGDIEPSGILKRIALLLVDQFYDSDHDMVVNTPSMTGGGTRAVAIPVLFAKGKEVLHTHYFKNGYTRDGLLDALLQKKDPKNFHPELPDHSPIPRGAVLPDAAVNRPTTFVLPGVIGTHLAKGNERIWIDLSELFCGRFRELAIKAPNTICPQEPVASTYASLISFLEKSHRVIPFGYDWRLSLLYNGRLLAAAVEECLATTNQPVRIVAHSMGGLVVRSMLALHPGTWQKLRQRPGSRIILLGTPWQGSWSIPRILVKQEKLIKMLAMLDVRDNHDDLVRIIREFPGILEMLPHDQNGSQIGDSEWDSCKRILAGRWLAPKKSALANAATTWNNLERAAIDPARLFYIAGHAQQTPAAMNVDEDAIIIKASSMGDGQVLWATGIPKGVQHWFVDAVHGDIPSHKDTQEALLDLFERGTTERLASQPPLSRESDQLIVLPPDRVDWMPNGSDLAAAALGRATPTNSAPTTKLLPLEIEVIHGNLCFLDNVLAVGHYDGDTIVSAEGALDDRLDNRLRKRLQAGVYPGPLRTSEVFFNEAGNRFKGAIVIGLGEPGSLTGGELTATFRDALLKYVMSGLECQKLQPGRLELASLLIGTGAGGITIHESVESIIEAVLQANRQLLELYNDPAMTVQRLEFNEIFADTAIQSQRVVCDLADHSRFSDRIKPTPLLTMGEGGRNRLYYSEDADWWRRLRIETVEDNSLVFTAMTNSARALVTSQPVTRSKVDYFLKQATNNSDPEIGRVLFEMLVPPEFKSHAANNERLMLVVDEQSAGYPWELLEYKGRTDNEAIALKAGLIRQLTTKVKGAAPKICSKHNALVIGDPNLEGMQGFSQLPGAREEAEIVHSVLASHGIALDEPMIFAKSHDIRRKLLIEEFGILHLAGHGDIDYLPPEDQQDTACSCTSTKPQTGMVIGNNQFLTSEDITTMPTPAFVFLNCCFLGKIDGRRTGTLKEPHKLAANLATQFIQQGVKAVIASGWAVNDDAAKIFARTFYQHFLDGYCFGDAVKEARIQTHKRSSANTWGAYQCYGDPGFCIGREFRSMPSRKATRHCSLSEFVVACDNIACDAKTAADVYTDRLRKKMEDLEKLIPSEYMDADPLLQARGLAWREINEPDKAAKCFRQLIQSPSSGGSMRCAERLADLEGRIAISLWKNGDAQSIRQALVHIRDAHTLIDNMNTTFGISGERLSIIGINCRRQAMVLSRLDKEQVIQSLQQMFKNSYRAFQTIEEKTGQLSSRPLTNWVAANYLLGICGAQEGASEEPLELIHRALQSSIVSDTNTENFWQRAALIDLDLMQNLLQNNLEAKKQEIITNYRQIMQKASSARQICVTRGFLEFLDTVLAAFDRRNIHLQEIIDQGLDCL